MNTEKITPERIIPEPTDAQPTLPLPDDALADAMTPDAAASPDGTASDVSPAPRTRWAAIVWGIFLATLAWAGIWILSSPTRRDDVTDWLAGLTPGTITALGLLSLGVLVLITGLVGLIRRAQRTLRS